MKNNLIRIAFAVIVLAFALKLTVFKSKGSNNKESSTEITSTKQVSSSNSSSFNLHEAPAGYKRGSDCSDCEGTGKVRWKGYDAVCAGCNGKGYHWVKE